MYNLDMPIRREIFIEGEYYHIYNRCVFKQKMFTDKNDYKRFLNLLRFYQFTNTGVKFSKYNSLTIDNKKEFMTNLLNSERQVTTIAFALMPNHYHVLLKQETLDGIKNFIHKLQTSYSKYFNIKRDRYGTLFQSRFKAKIIKSEEQLIHVTRYIHLNPLTSFIFQEAEELRSHLYTSYFDYINEKSRHIIDKDIIMSYFSNPAEFESFTFNQVEYQRGLNLIKDIVIES